MVEFDPSKKADSVGVEKKMKIHWELTVLKYS